MKMTRLEWRYLQRIALDHPYFDTHKLPLTEKEAKAIVEANNRMTGREFVDSIYAKLGMTRQQEEKKHFAWLRNFGELFTVPPIRKIAIAVLVAVLMTVFFAATPTGRAIAESVIQYIATLFEDGRIVFDRNDDETPPHLTHSDNFSGDEMQEVNDITTHITFLDSFEEFTQITGKTPVILSFTCEEIYFTYDDELDYLDITATYNTSLGKIVVCQIWNVEYLETVTMTGYDIYSADETIYYSIEKEENRIHCQWVLEDSVLIVSSEGDFTIDYLIRAIRSE
jgi:hypothetical protein